MSPEPTDLDWRDCLFEAEHTLQRTDQIEDPAAYERKLRIAMDWIELSIARRNFGARA